MALVQLRVGNDRAVSYAVYCQQCPATLEEPFFPIAALKVGGSNESRFLRSD